LCGDLVIVNPGAPEASVAALDAATGKTRWRTPGPPAAYSSFLLATLGGRDQIVGYDQHSLGGWDPRTGERLWQLRPEQEGDFNVPTPLVLDGRLVVATENNGTRMYEFDATGKIIPQPFGTAAMLAPNTATPVATCGRVFGTDRGIHCLDAARRLQPVWHLTDASLGDHASLLASKERVLIVTMTGELILLDARAEDCRILSRQRVFGEDVEIYSHPAMAGNRLFLRGRNTLACLELAP
jgi:outer membrane protein assembly factor BamB